MINCTALGAWMHGVGSLEPEPAFLVAGFVIPNGWAADFMPFDTSLPAPAQAKVDAITAMAKVRQQLVHPGCVSFTHALQRWARMCATHPRAVSLCTRCAGRAADIGKPAHGLPARLQHAGFPTHSRRRVLLPRPHPARLLARPGRLPEDACCLEVKLLSDSKVHARSCLPTRFTKFPP